MNRDEIEGLIAYTLGLAERLNLLHMAAHAEDAEKAAHALLALLPALPPGEPTDDEVRDWAYNTLATDTDGDTRGVWWSTITPARKGMYRRAMLAARPALSTESGWDDPNKADLWWVSDDPEEGHFDTEEAYDHGTGGSPEIGIVHLERGKRLSDVWAVRVVLTRDEDGEPDDTEVRCFHTKAEAEAALPTPPTESK